MTKETIEYYFKTCLVHLIRRVKELDELLHEMPQESYDRLENTRDFIERAKEFKKDNNL